MIEYLGGIETEFEIFKPFKMGSNPEKRLKISWHIPFKILNANSTKISNIIKYTYIHPHIFYPALLFKLPVTILYPTKQWRYVA